jgi:phosphoserine aminotransferase
MKKHNFSSGPAILPQVVLQKAAEAVTDLNGMGLSILEISHRSKAFTEIIKETEALTKELLNIDDSYSVLFLTGGASSQFYMTAMNLLNPNETACFIDTGTWSYNAIQEAKLFGNVEVLASSQADRYTYIPKNFTIPANAKYLHITTNNTIYGTQFHQIPNVSVPIVADMSSDIFSKPIEIEKYGLIYAGAQKNIGPAGVTLVIIKKDWLPTLERKLPTMLDFRTHIKKESLFNTPPVFPIYVSMLTMRWLKAQGGVAAIEKHNQHKAAILYHEIDENPYFKGNVATEDRSLMNVTFDVVSSDLAAPFLAACESVGISGIKGHRSVGGFRASIYNAMPLESVELLVDVMHNFKK